MKLSTSDKVSIAVLIIMWIVVIYVFATLTIQECRYDNLEELRPCPFCGSTNIEYMDYDKELAFEGTYLENYEEVTCHNCGANTFRNKLSTDKVSAIEKWNSRK